MPVNPDLPAPAGTMPRYAPDSEDALIEARGADRAQARLGKVTALDADPRYVMVSGLQPPTWTLRARLLRQRLAVSAEHFHVLPAGQTESSTQHTHGLIEEESSVEPGHTHEVEVRVDDVGIVLLLSGGVPAFIGGW